MPEESKAQDDVPRLPRPAREGRDFVTPDDVRAMAFGVLDHRIVLRPEAEIEGVRTQEVLEAIFHEIPVPR